MRSIAFVTRRHLLTCQSLLRVFRRRARSCQILAFTLAVAFSNGGFSASCDPTWTQVASPGPGSREFPAVAFHAGSGRIILFGGKDRVTTLSDTWGWDGSAWSRLSPPESPLARSGHAMSARSSTRVALFGGRDEGGYRDALWFWDGAA